MSFPRKFTMIRPDDFHVHLRRGRMLQQVTKYTAEVFGRALVMPNTTVGIVNHRLARNYYEEIMRNVRGDFRPLMTIKLTTDTSKRMIVEAAASRYVYAAKLYPEGVTTNSGDGFRDITELYPVFDQMQASGLILCLHGELPGAGIDTYDREKKFLRVLDQILTEFPELKVVLEHISTREATQYVTHDKSGRLGATVTAHHLKLTRNDVVGQKIRPHNHCRPPAQRFDDRDRLIRAVTNPGQTQFFFGSDSAPHSVLQKECADGCAGVFTAPVAMPLLAQLFEAAGSNLDALQRFTSLNGAAFYGLEPNQDTITLSRQPWEVPAAHPEPNWNHSLYGVVPFLAGEELTWQVVG